MQYLEDSNAAFPYAIRIGKSDHVFNHVYMHEIFSWADKTLGDQNVVWSFELDRMNNELEFRFLDKKGAMAFKLRWLK